MQETANLLQQAVDQMPYAADLSKGVKVRGLGLRVYGKGFGCRVKSLRFRVPSLRVAPLIIPLPHIVPLYLKGKSMIRGWGVVIRGGTHEFWVSSIVKQTASENRRCFSLKCQKQG